MNKNQRIGIFGGTFDPFTTGHMAIVEKCLEQDLIDVILIVPSIITYYRPTKDKWLTDSQILDIIQTFIQKSEYHDRIFISGVEYEFAKCHSVSECNNRRYIDTLTDIRNNINQILPASDQVYDWYTIIGTDSYENFKTWSKWNDILELSKLIVVQGRNGKNVQVPDIPKIDIKINKKHENVSASAIRAKYLGIDNLIAFNMYKNTILSD